MDELSDIELSDIVGLVLFTLLFTFLAAIVLLFVLWIASLFGLVPMGLVGDIVSFAPATLQWRVLLALVSLTLGVLASLGRSLLVSLLQSAFSGCVFTIGAILVCTVAFLVLLYAATFVGLVPAHVMGGLFSSDPSTSLLRWIVWGIIAGIGLLTGVMAVVGRMKELLEDSAGGYSYERHWSDRYEDEDDYDYEQRIRRMLD